MPRRHLSGVPVVKLSHHVGRSTKAGDHAPATRARPEADHLRHALRSTKAGDHAPATRARPEADHLRHALRSTKAGDHAPATRPTACGAPRRRSPLNQGRGPCPGDTRCLQGAEPDDYGRSTKAGDHAPATLLDTVNGAERTFTAQPRPGTMPRRHFSDSRSAVEWEPEYAQPRPGTMPRRHRGSENTMIKEADIVAQPRPGTMPRRHEPQKVATVIDIAGRSTKAGDHAPATPASRGRRPSCRRPLNQGRGPCPGDTIVVLGYDGKPERAQPRPGTMPRRHDLIMEDEPSAPGDAQPRPGTMPRRHLIDTSRAPARSARAAAQPRPGTMPRRHPQVRSTSPSRVTAQPRPGTMPRRHRLKSKEPTGKGFSSLNQGRGPCPGDTRRDGDGSLDGDNLRSTKAGDHAPATPTFEPTTSSSLARSAQPRPGTMPRRHC